MAHITLQRPRRTPVHDFRMIKSRRWLGSSLFIFIVLFINSIWAPFASKTDYPMASTEVTDDDFDRFLPLLESLLARGTPEVRTRMYVTRSKKSVAPCQ